LAFASTCLSGLPRFVFASSIGAAGFGNLGYCLKEENLSVENGVNNIGYGQSKLVTEKARLSDVPLYHFCANIVV
jgi:nucleoside-diphosphate-sugar epimerase